MQAHPSRRCTRRRRTQRWQRSQRGRGAASLISLLASAVDRAYPSQHRAMPTSEGSSTMGGSLRRSTPRTIRMAQTTPVQRDAPGPVVSSAEASRLVAHAPAVDAVGLEGRAASLATRSIKREAKVWAMDLVVRCIDLTTLEGTDTTGKIVAMCAKAVRPDPLRPDVPPVAAVCLYPQLVPVAVEQLRGTGVAVASV